MKQISVIKRIMPNCRQNIESQCLCIKVFKRLFLIVIDTSLIAGIENDSVVPLNSIRRFITNSFYFISKNYKMGK